MAPLWQHLKTIKDKTLKELGPIELFFYIFLVNFNMNLKKINLLKAIIISLVILSFTNFAWSQNLPVHKFKFQTITTIFHNFKREKQKLTEQQIIYRSNLIIQEYRKEYEIENFTAKKAMKI